MEPNASQDIVNRLDEQQRKIEAVFVSVEKTRKYFKWTLIISVAMIVLPMIGLAFAIPAFLQTLQMPAGLGL